LSGLALLSGLAVTGPRAAADDPPKEVREPYFPKVSLVNQDGKESLFYDLIKDRIVVINFMYVTCEGKLCGEGTRNLVKLQNALGDRLGRDVFMYSITLTPAVDKPGDLKEYAKKNDARWTFLAVTAETDAKKKEGTTALRRKLGLYDSKPEKDEDLKSHTGMIVMGNVKLDKWSKTSIMSSPDKILQMIERLKPPGPPSP
jgi:protein SCO1/2